LGRTYQGGLNLLNLKTSNSKKYLPGYDIREIFEDKNKSLESFPFPLGWYSYFKSFGKISFEENLIKKKIIKNNIKMLIQIKNTQFDDCFITKEGKVSFITSD
jgi:hypothetical protein